MCLEGRGVWDDTSMKLSINQVIPQGHWYTPTLVAYAFNFNSWVVETFSMQKDKAAEKIEERTSNKYLSFA